MTPINPGNILPFYTDKDMQRHRQTGQGDLPFGLIAYTTRLIPFQIYRPTGTISSAALVAVNAQDETDTVDITSAVLDIHNRVGGGGWVTFKDQAITDTIPCGYWYLQLQCGFAGTFFSEVLWVRNLLEVPRYSTLNWYSDTDKGTVLYQDGYRQRLYTEPWVVFDIPTIETDIDESENGFGETTDTYSRTVERPKFEVKDIPDYALATLAGVGFNETVTLQLAFAGLLATTYTLPKMRFTSRRQGKELNTGVFEFDGRSEIFTGCQENFEIEM